MPTRDRCQPGSAGEGDRGQGRRGHGVTEPVAALGRGDGVPHGLGFIDPDEGRWWDGIALQAGSSSTSSGFAQDATAAVAVPQSRPRGADIRWVSGGRTEGSSVQTPRSAPPPPRPPCPEATPRGAGGGAQAQHSSLVEALMSDTEARAVLKEAGRDPPLLAAAHEVMAGRGATKCRSDPRLSARLAACVRARHH